MAKASRVKQLSFTMPNNVGLLMEITEALAKAKVNIEAITAYGWEELEASFMILTDNNAKAKKALAKLGAKVEIEPAQLVWGAKRIIGVIMYDAWVVPRALDFLVRNRTRWPFDRLLSHKYPLEQINQAFADSEWHARETTSITRAALVP